MSKEKLRLGQRSNTEIGRGLKDRTRSAGKKERLTQVEAAGRTGVKQRSGQNALSIVEPVDVEISGLASASWFTTLGIR